MRKVDHPTVQAIGFSESAYRPILRFIELLGKVKKQCEADNLFLRVDNPSGYTEFELVAEWYREGQRITFTRMFSLFQLNELIESPVVALRNFAEDAKNAMIKALAG